MKCKTCGKEYINPYVNTGYCSKICENKKPKEDETLNQLKNMFGMK